MAKMWYKPSNMVGYSGVGVPVLTDMVINKGIPIYYTCRRPKYACAETRMWRQELVGYALADEIEVYRIGRLVVFDKKEGSNE